MNKKIDLFSKLMRKKERNEAQVKIRTTKRRATNKLRKSAQQAARRRAKS